jgi:hypothetical protein
LRPGSNTKVGGCEDAAEEAEVSEPDVEEASDEASEPGAEADSEPSSDSSPSSDSPLSDVESLSAAAA